MTDYRKFSLDGVSRRFDLHSTFFGRMKCKFGIHFYSAGNCSDEAPIHWHGCRHCGKVIYRLNGSKKWVDIDPGLDRRLSFEF